MTRSELEHRLATFQNHHALDKIEISERDPNNFHVALTLRPNIPISERLILRLENAIGGRLKSLLVLRSPTNVAVLRFMVGRGAIGNETQADRAEETATVSYAKADRGYLRIASTKTASAPRSGPDRLASSAISFASKDRPSRGKVMDASSIKRADIVVKINRS